MSVLAKVGAAGVMLFVATAVAGCMGDAGEDPDSEAVDRTADELRGLDAFELDPTIRRGQPSELRYRVKVKAHHAIRLKVGAPPIKKPWVRVELLGAACRESNDPDDCTHDLDPRENSFITNTTDRDKVYTIRLLNPSFFRVLFSVFDTTISQNFWEREQGKTTCLRDQACYYGPEKQKGTCKDDNGLFGIGVAEGDFNKELIGPRVSDRCAH